MPIKNKILSALFPSYGCDTVKIDAKSRRIACELCPENFGRALVLSKFIDVVTEIFPISSIIRVAVVGGYQTEPEIRALKYLGYEVKIEVFGIEDNMVALDLNVALSDTQKYGVNFDLILCSQVWEHIWNHHVALNNLISIMNQRGYLWIASPASNRAHGSPFYFSAGFTSEYFANNLSKAGLVIKSHGQIGTRRNYLATHTLPAWLSVKGHRFPPIFAFSHLKLPTRIFYFVRYSMETISLISKSAHITSNSKYATESWVLASLKRES